MHAEGWRRLWELMKCLAAIAAAVWCVTSFSAAMPPPTDPESPTAGQVAVGAFLVAVIGGGLAYSALHALEWVYRGFRPLAVTPKEVSPSALNKPEAAQAIEPEQRPALPHPDDHKS